MDIVFFTKEADICQKMADILSKDNHSCTVMTDDTQFLFLLTDVQFKCDLLVCDFRSIPHQSFSIYGYLKDMACIKPVIFYNDPIPEDGRRTEYWLRTNESLFRKKFTGLIPLFKRIEDIVESPGINPYISLLQAPRSLTKPADGESRHIDISRFRKRNGLSPVMYKLFECFYKNVNREVSVKELSKAIWPVSKRNHCNINSIYTYISRLRKTIEKDKLVKIDIIRTDLASYEMVIY